MSFEKDCFYVESPNALGTNTKVYYIDENGRKIQLNNINEVKISIKAGDIIKMELTGYGKLKSVTDRDQVLYTPVCETCESKEASNG